MKVSPHRPTKALIYLGAIRQNSANGGLLKWAVVRRLWSWGCRRMDSDDVTDFNIDEAIELRLADLARKILIWEFPEAVSLANTTSP